MLEMYHVSGRKVAEKSQPPAAGGSKSTSTAEVSVAPSSGAANTCLGTKTRPHHLSFPLASVSKLDATYLVTVSLMNVRKSEKHWNYKIKLSLV